MTSLHLGTRRVAAAVLATSTVFGAVPWTGSTALGAGNPPAPPEATQNRGARGPDPADPPGTTRDVRVLAIGPAGFLELKTLSGSISVAGGTGREARLEIVTRPRGRSSDELRRSLESVEVVVDHQGERATVTTVARGDRRGNTRADVSFVVTAPAGTRVTVHTASGNVTVRDIKGEISAEVTSGDIRISNAGSVSTARTISGDVTLANVSSRGDLSVGSMSGTIVAEQVTADRVDIDVASGSITARDVTSTRATVRTLSGTVEFTGRLVKGGRYEFVSHSGNVRVNTSGAGYVLQASSFSGSIRPDANLGLRATSGNARSLRGTVGDGSATVVATTFSGNVTIGRQ